MKGNKSFYNTNCCKLRHLARVMYLLICFFSYGISCFLHNTAFIDMYSDLDVYKFILHHSYKILFLKLLRLPFLHTFLRCFFVTLLQLPRLAKPDFCFYRPKTFWSRSNLPIWNFCDKIYCRRFGLFWGWTYIKY